LMQRLCDIIKCVISYSLESVVAMVMDPVERIGSRMFLLAGERHSDAAGSAGGVI